MVAPGEIARLAIVARTHLQLPLRGALPVSAVTVTADTHGAGAQPIGIVVQCDDGTRHLVDVRHDALHLVDGGDEVSAWAVNEPRSLSVVDPRGQFAVALPTVSDGHVAPNVDGNGNGYIAVDRSAAVWFVATHSAPPVRVSEGLSSAPDLEVRLGSIPVGAAEGQAGARFFLVARAVDAPPFDVTRKRFPEATILMLDARGRTLASYTRTPATIHSVAWSSEIGSLLIYEVDGLKAITQDNQILLPAQGFPAAVLQVIPDGVVLVRTDGSVERLRWKSM